MLIVKTLRALVDPNQPHLVHPPHSPGAPFQLSPGLSVRGLAGSQACLPLALLLKSCVVSEGGPGLLPHFA